MSDKLESVAEELVRSKILGSRKGSSEPASEHSFRVRDALKQYGYTEEVVLAGLLHDIIEDSDVTESVLRELGFSDRTRELVLLCTHDERIEDGDKRWIVMMANLIKAGDKEAWAIKTADITDNLRSCHTMAKERCKFMREAKGPFFLNISKSALENTPIWEELKKELA